MEQILLNMGVSDSKDPGKPAPGALLQARNVMFVRPGVVDQRPGFGASGSFTASVASRQPRSLIDYPKAPNESGVLVYYTNSASFSNKSYIWGNNTNALSVSYPYNFVSPLDGNFADAVGKMERENLYVPDLYAGLIKATGPNASNMMPVGIDPPNYPTLAVLGTSATAAQNWLPTGESVAYLILFKRQDVNGVVYRSSPATAPIVITSAAGANCYVIVGLNTLYQTGLVEGTDSIEIYRTRSGVLATANNYAELGSYYLVGSVPYIAANSGTVNELFRDTYSNDELGAEIYTGPGQQGGAAANWVPPCGSSIESFGGCLWQGNVFQRPSFSPTSVKLFATSTPTTVDFSGGFKYREISITYTNGSTTATMANTSMVRVGMFLTNTAGSKAASSTHFPANTAIAAIVNSTTVTLSKPATATGALTTFVQDYLAISSPAGTDVLYFGDGTGGTVDTTPSVGRNSTEYLSLFISFSSVLHSSRYIWTGEATDLGSFQVWTRAGQPMKGSMTILTSAPEALGGLPSTKYQDATYIGYILEDDGNDHSNGVAYAKPDQPEHWPVGNFIRIGDRSAKVVALKALRDALMVFKEDGIWRITGTGPSNWAVDQLDTETRLAKPDALCELDNVIYALTNRGIVALTEYNVEVISQPTLAPDSGQQFPQDDPLYAARKFTPTNATDGSRGCYAVALPHRGLVCFAIPRELLQNTASFWWVYNPSLNAWSQWDITARCALNVQSQAAVLLDSGTRSRSTFELRLESYDTALTNNYQDRVWTGLTTPVLSNANNFTVTYANFGNYKPQSGDFILLPSSSAFVSFATDTGTGWSVTLDRFVSSSGGSSTAVESIPVRLQWSPVTSASPYNPGQWTEAVLEMFDVTTPTYLAGTVYLDFIASPDPSGAATARKSLNTFFSEQPGQLSLYRFGVPRSVSRNHAVSLLAYINAPGQQWRLGQASLNRTSQTKAGRTMIR